ncbi:dATP/dGTP pyrophosphohydrolase domain-containing protein [Salmonella enterica]|uniref:dATP/dGTP pyrophosphohydrolase domain-containing protein n=1 Tax=Salmonella enterica TaxID=28901 RepID=UPI001279929A|nr:DUF550 domain-containing protein [Salmonella enterica subsp. enterica serovar Muenster]EDB3343872.1 DUF550 domain-containing protein [Salmonella enterica subsp. enterica serovar Give]EJT0872354.1 DUF550 domain-containing protein [Salmonella enterica]HCB4961491.1 DUF550 domain-containing protein [Salmonella enterica subsp. enterica serovar Muenster]
MTTITKEWLQQTIAEFENTRDDIPFGLSDDDAKILIVLKRALASLEAAADPSDPLEWADMQFLLWDAQRRMGLSDEFITRAMIEKLAINKTRQWPEPKDGEPRLHIKEQSAPVIPDGWINCSERMPAQDDWVLIYSKYGEYLAGQVQGEYVELNDGTLSWLGAALHWMPLPEPPQEVK